MAWLDRLGHMSGECHSHTLYTDICDRTQSTVNGQTTQTGAINGQKRLNIQILVWNRPRIQAFPSCSISLAPGPFEKSEKRAWYPLFAHVLNFLIFLEFQILPCKFLCAVIVQKLTVAICA